MNNASNLILNSINDNTKIVIQDLPDQSGVHMSAEIMVHLDKSLEKVNSIKLEDPPTPSKIPKIVKIICQNIPQIEPAKIEQNIPYRQNILKSFLFRKFNENN